MAWTSVIVHWRRSKVLGSNIRVMVDSPKMVLSPSTMVVRSCSSWTLRTISRPRSILSDRSRLSGVFDRG
ncbi:hypothetical protein D3C87_2191570 [compost metagenome]